MPSLCAAVRERWPVLQRRQDDVLALLALLAVVLLMALVLLVGWPWRPAPQGHAPGHGVQQAALDDDYIFED
jgi:hypothetical protein